MGQDQSLTSTCAVAERGLLTRLSPGRFSCDPFQLDDRGVAVRQSIDGSGFSFRLLPAGESLPSRQV